MRKATILILLLCNLIVHAQDTLKSKVSVWSFGFSASAGLATLHSNQTSRTFEGLVDTMGNIYMQIWGSSFQIFTNYQFKKRLNLTFGLQYMLNGNHKFSDPLLSIIPPFNSGNELDRYNKIAYLNIPLAVEYSLFKRGRLKLGLGVFYGINLGSSTTITYSDGSPDETISNDVKYKNDFGIKASLSYRFKLFKKLYLPLTLGYNHGIKDINNPKPNDTEMLKTRNWNLGLGLIYNL